MDAADRLLDTAARLAEALSPADLDSTLEAITRTAVRVLPQVDFASITVNQRDGRLETRAPSHDLLVDVDAYQYAERQGPCYHAAESEAAVISPNLAADERFPAYGRYAVDAGIRSQAGLRLFTGPTSQGALNLYSTKVGAFEDFEALGALFATQAGMAIGYALEIGNLQEALRTRTAIGQAVGIVMERYAMTDERAFAFLTRISQHRNVKLRLVAQEIIAASEQRGAEEE
jgi:GAF domain-containing protein